MSDRATPLLDVHTEGVGWPPDVLVPFGPVISATGRDLSPLASPFEEALLRRLAAFPAELELAARELSPHLVTTYLRELAGEFHSYYNAERFLVDDPVLQKARLALVAATGQVVKNGLAVLGIGAPDQM